MNLLQGCLPNSEIISSTIPHQLSVGDRNMITPRGGPENLSMLVVKVLRHEKGKSFFDIHMEEGASSGLKNVVFEFLRSSFVFEKMKKRHRMETDDPDMLTLDILKGLRYYGWTLLTSNAFQHVKDHSTVETTFYFEKGADYGQRGAMSPFGVSEEKSMAHGGGGSSSEGSQIQGQLHSHSVDRQDSTGSSGSGGGGLVSNNTLTRRQSFNREKLMQKYTQHRKSSFALSRSSVSDTTPSTTAVATAVSGNSNPADTEAAKQQQQQQQQQQGESAAEKIYQKYNHARRSISTRGVSQISLEVPVSARDVSDRNSNAQSANVSSEQRSTNPSPAPSPAGGGGEGTRPTSSSLQRAFPPVSSAADPAVARAAAEVAAYTEEQMSKNSASQQHVEQQQQPEEQSQPQPASPSSSSPSSSSSSSNSTPSTAPQSSPRVPLLSKTASVALRDEDTEDVRPVTSDADLLLASTSRDSPQQPGQKGKVEVSPTGRTRPPPPPPPPPTQPPQQQQQQQQPLELPAATIGSAYTSASAVNESEDEAEQERRASLSFQSPDMNSMVRTLQRQATSQMQQPSAHDSSKVQHYSKLGSTFFSGNSLTNSRRGGRGGSMSGRLGGRGFG